MKDDSSSVFSAQPAIDCADSTPSKVMSRRLANPHWERFLDETLPGERKDGRKKSINEV